MLHFHYKTLFFLIAGHRADVTIYFCDTCPADYKPDAGQKIKFKPPQWQPIKTLRRDRQPQKYVLSTPKTTRFVALARNGFVHLVEVEIFGYPSEYFYIVLHEVVHESQLYQPSKDRWPVSHSCKESSTLEKQIAGVYRIIRVMGCPAHAALFNSFEFKELNH